MEMIKFTLENVSNDDYELINFAFRHKSELIQEMGYEDNKLTILAKYIDSEMLKVALYFKAKTEFVFVFI